MVSERDLWFDIVCPAGGSVVDALAASVVIAVEEQIVEAADPTAAVEGLELLRQQCAYQQRRQAVLRHAMRNVEPEVPKEIPVQFRDVAAEWIDEPVGVEDHALTREMSSQEREDGRLAGSTGSHHDEQWLERGSRVS